MEIKSVRRFAKTKNMIVVNEHYIYNLDLRKDELKGNRITLTAKRTGYTSKGIQAEVNKKRKELSQSKRNKKGRSK